MKIRYNAPFSLSFSILCVLVLALSYITGGASTTLLFSVYPSENLLDPFFWIRLFGHVLGHANWEHLLSNLSFILLLGPILEEKYGSKIVLLMVLITAFCTGLLNILLFKTGLLGASGIVFMFIILASFTNIRSGELPLTFIAILIIYLSREIINSFQNDSISQFAHILGGTLGSIFGFLLTLPGSKETHV